MSSLITAVVTQSLTFLPLALGISVSYTLLRATDMTLDGSFVLGAGVFARLVTLGVSPAIAGVCALLAGSLAGVMVSLIQKGGRVDPLLAGVLATFILTSANLIVMGRPNINLLSQHTLLSSAFAKSDFDGWILVATYCFSLCLISCALIRTRFGLILRALGDNPNLLQRLGILTAQTVGYADTSMGFGMTLTGIGAIILGQQILRVIIKSSRMRVLIEFSACVVGVLLYFFAINGLLRFDIDPVYLKMTLGIILVLFLRTAVNPGKLRNVA
jgi:putative ABC transport system permease protein